MFFQKVMSLTVLDLILIIHEDNAFNTYLKEIRADGKHTKWQKILS
ncbi:hypothetical protein [Psychromonas sp. MB-3u-54]|nr:hypothetical protein [Psychromonas sp. MB-3u-54]